MPVNLGPVIPLQVIPFLVGVGVHVTPHLSPQSPSPSHPQEAGRWGLFAKVKLPRVLQQYRILFDRGPCCSPRFEPILILEYRRFGLAPSVQFTNDARCWAACP